MATEMIDIGYDALDHIPKRFHRHGALLASENERRILRTIWDLPGITRAELGDHIGLTQQSIHRLLVQLADDGLVTIGAVKPPRSSGKPSPALTLNPRWGCSVGVSLDTDHAGIAVMDLAGQHRTRDLVLDTPPEFSKTTAMIQKAIGKLLDEVGAAHDAVIGLGFAISGYRMEPECFNPPQPLMDWANRPLGPELQPQLDMAVWSENGANSGALCEALFGAGRGIDDFVYLSFNYGFGAGIIADGKLLKGGFGNAGEISGMFTPDEMIDRPALRSLVEMHREAGQPIDTVADLADRTLLDPDVCKEWIERVSPLHNRMLNVLAATVDPALIVYGGQIPGTVAAQLMGRTVFHSKPRHGHQRAMPRQVASKIGVNGSAVGAACIPLLQTLL